MSRQIGSLQLKFTKCLIIANFKGGGGGGGGSPLKF